MLTQSKAFNIFRFPLTTSFNNKNKNKNEKKEEDIFQTMCVLNTQAKTKIICASEKRRFLLNILICLSTYNLNTDEEKRREES